MRALHRILVRLRLAEPRFRVVPASAEGPLFAAARHRRGDRMGLPQLVELPR